MSMRMTREEIATVADVQPEQKLHGTTVDRSFRLPGGIYGLTVGCYLGFLAVMAVGFGNPYIIIPMVIFAVSIIAGFTIPYIWATMKPGSGQRAPDWGRFQGEGIETLTGRLTAGEAAAQVLVLPVLIFLWGIAAIIIGSLVGG